MKLLVISGHRASSDTANGLTILNVARCLKPESIASFHAQRSSGPSDEIATSFCVSDTDVLNYLRHRRPPQVVENDSAGPVSPVHKTAFKQLIRYHLWQLSPWKGKGFSQWVENYSPDAILLYLADNLYQIKLAIHLSKKKGVPLFIFTGENYCFKKFDYISKKLKPGLGYRLFHKKLFRLSLKACKKATLVMLNSDPLRLDYEASFKINNTLTVYPLSERIPSKRPLSPIKTILYGGNYGLLRYQSIVELALDVYSLDPSIAINVYGKGDAAGEEALSKEPNIRLHGYVSADELNRQIDSSDLLIHCETFDPYYSEDLKRSFSTKITESLMSGIPFLIYAPAHFSGTQYCKSIQGPFVATNSDELRELLSKIIRGETTYDLDIGRLVANHGLQNNYERIAKFMKASQS